MACFADINVSQGRPIYSVATCARCAGMFNIHLTANLPRNLPVKKTLKSLRFDRIMVMSLWRRLRPTMYQARRNVFISGGTNLYEPYTILQLKSFA